MMCDQAITDRAICLEGDKSAFLILAHQSAVPDHIGCKDGSHSALNAIHAHANSRGGPWGIISEMATPEESWAKAGRNGVGNIRWLFGPTRAVSGRRFPT